jgi:tRNA nucleotidyltransferase (CCA-adding enzyme)
VRDPFDGRADLNAKLVRAVGDPEQRMREDRLRALRGIRFAARYGFEIEHETLRAIRESAPYLTRLSAERVQQEMVKTMEQVAAPSEAFRLWRDSGALAVLVPALTTINDVALGTLDCLARDGVAGRNVPQRTTNRIAALFLDCTPANARAATTALRFSKHETNWTATIVEKWAVLGPAMAKALESGKPSDVDVRRWLGALGRMHSSAFLRVAGARWSAMRGAGGEAPSAASVAAVHRRMVDARYSAAIEIADLAIGGDELRAAGIPAGPIYGKILNVLLEHVLETPARNTPEALLGELPQILATMEPGTTNALPRQTT